ncbi:DUF1028 domain-containing protein [Acidianus sp. RZ1]|uniref:DUF1028 domain-containing protein n=1 Tax=Acidianus sp. RZ1 TaxID=1540082 RepID=UPI0014914DC5|nr:DUF1028 domain-containing protein [Acidianus sp. RZ1]NON62566.1 DUF1028 domain-containing protein [Acidianus sp. RZ1]
MTFSIVIYDPEIKAWGIGVASKFLAVGAFVPWLKPGAGAIATQALANLKYGVEGLQLLEKYDAKTTLEKLISSDPLRERRQVGIVDSKGSAVAFTGKECYPYAGHIIGNNFTVQGNILAGEEVLEVMAKVAEGKGKIHEKIFNALLEADNKGGDRRGKQSAAIVVVKMPGGEDSEINPSAVGKFLDIRVDDHSDPINEIGRVMKIWEATFLEEEMVNVKDYESEISEALRKLGYKDLKSWIEVNNFENKFTGDKIGKNVLEILLS